MNRPFGMTIDHKVIDRWVDEEQASDRLRFGALEINISGATAYHRTFGFRDKEGARPVDAQTRFWIASMTKPITTCAAMMLVERGLLHLDAPVADFVAGFGGAGVLQPDGRIVPVMRPPTIRDLMIHTSGLTYGKFGTGNIHRRYQAADTIDYAADNAAIAARIAKLPLLHQPGTVFEYGMSTDILGYVVEIVTGQPLARAFDTLIFSPLAMTATSFSPDPENVAWIPPSDIESALAPPFQAEPAWHSGGAGLFSTTADYLAFARMLMGGGRHNGAQLLHQSRMSAMIQDQLPPNIRFGAYTGALGPAAPWPGNGLSFGFGLAVRTRPHPKIPGNVGEFSWPGASGCNFWVDPTLAMVVVFLNHESDARVHHRFGVRKAVYSALQ